MCILFKFLPPLPLPLHWIKKKINMISTITKYRMTVAIRRDKTNYNGNKTVKSYFYKELNHQELIKIEGSTKHFGNTHNIQIMWWVKILIFKFSHYKLFLHCQMGMCSDLSIPGLGLSYCSTFFLKNPL